MELTVSQFNELLSENADPNTNIVIQDCAGDEITIADAWYEEITRIEGGKAKKYKRIILQAD